MKYSESPALNAVYELIGSMFELDDRPADAMKVAEALTKLGEGASWAGVWWSYGAAYFDMTDEAYARALELLPKVTGPVEAKAAALLLQSTIYQTTELLAYRSPDPDKQIALLREAVALMPAWPSLHIALAGVLNDAGRGEDATVEASVGLGHLGQRSASDEPFDTAFTGYGDTIDSARDWLVDRGVRIA